MTERAIVGLGPAGDSLKVVSETLGKRTESRRALALDYAFVLGAADEFEALLRSRCRWLNDCGSDTLSLYSSPASRGSAELCALAREVEPFNMWTPGIAVPPGANDHGLYTDPVYF